MKREINDLNGSEWIDRNELLTEYKKQLDRPIETLAWLVALIVSLGFIFYTLATTNFIHIS